MRTHRLAYREQRGTDRRRRGHAWCEPSEGSCSWEAVGQALDERQARYLHAAHRAQAVRSDLVRGAA